MFGEMGSSADTPTQPDHPTDRYVVAVSDDMAFRVMTARTTETVQAAIDAQEVTGQTAQRFAELLTGVILVRLTMAPQYRVQGILKGADDSGQIVADSHPEGWSRGLVRKAEGAERVRIGGNAILQVMRSMPNGSLHQGMVEVPEEGGLSASLMAYMAHSEQVISTIGVQCVLNGEGRVGASGGYLVQPLPDVPQNPLQVMTERLHHDFAELGPLLERYDASAERLSDELLYAMPHHRVDEQPLRFDCQCSDVRVMASLATLKREEIEQIIQDGERLDMTCEYCGAEYAVEPEQLRGLLETS
jgi:molecular chaperone Hsp33